MLQAITAVSVLAVVLLVAVLSVIRACRAPSTPVTPLETIHSWASARQLKIIQLEEVPQSTWTHFLRTIEYGLSGFQTMYSALVETSEGDLRECYFIYGNYTLGALIPQVNIRWTKTQSVKRQPLPPLE